MIIKNYHNLAANNVRKDALDVLIEGLNKVRPDILMRHTVRYNEDFNNLIVLNTHHDIISGRMFVIGAGKAAGMMAETLEKIMSPKFIEAGVINTWSNKYKTKKIKIHKAGHPWPNKNGVKGVKEMMALKEKYQIGKKDLVICLLSGGASAMMALPVEGVTVEEKGQLAQTLTKAGANIVELNTVRKHISKVKGGRLAEHFSPAKVLSIIISDVIGNDVEVISSGPTVNDKTTFRDAYDVLDKYKVQHKIPKSIIEHIEKGMQFLVAETPKNLNNILSYVIADNTTALEAMATKAKSMGYRPLIITTALTVSTRSAAKKLVADITSDKYSNYDALLFGGETTVTIDGEAGQGGRNQHFVATFINEMAAFDKKWAIASMSSDGRDSITNAAGAIADYETKRLAEKSGLDIERFLNTFNTYPFFDKLGNNLIITGDTGTNIADLGIFLRR